MTALLKDEETFGANDFPHVVLNTQNLASMDAVKDWLQANRTELAAAAERAGAVLFRGFPVGSAEDFDVFVEAFGLENFPYKESLSNAVRTNLTERVFTANEAPPEANIYLHHEMAQTPVYPDKLFFYCDIPAAAGGATPLCRSDILLERLRDEHPEFIADCEAKGLKYTNVFAAENDQSSGQGRSWKSLLNSETREQAEARLRALDYSWEWLEDDCLKITTPVLPAVMTLKDGRKVFFNQLIAAFHGWKDTRNDPSKAVRFGDDTPLPQQAMDRAIALADELSYDTQWQKGDVALIDNYVVMHGRRFFEGKRRVLASLANG